MKTSSRLFTSAAGAMLLAAVIAIPLAVGNQYYLQILANIGINIILVLGLNIITGLAGQLSLCQGAFFGIGAYACALLVMKAGLSFWLALPISALGTAVLGLAVSIPALRLRGHYLAMLTLAFTVIVAQVLTNWVEMTRGPSGLINIPWPDAIPLGFAEIRIATRNQYYVFIVLMVALMVYLAALVQRSRLGMSLTAIREDETAAEIMGINTQVCKVTAFALSAFFGAVAGGLYAHYAKILAPEEFGVLQSVNILIMMIIGGVGSVAGAIVGAVVFTILPEALRLFNDYRLIIFGLILVLVIIYFPHGIVGTARGWLRGGLRRSKSLGAVARLERIPPALKAPRMPIGGELLRVEGVTKQFGGLTALNGVDMQVRAGEVVGLIGPNGSGKTTLINVISGAYAPTHGRVLLSQDVISGKPAYRISHAGVSRTFQKIRIFKELTVQENVAAALSAEPRQGVLAPLRAGRLIGRSYTISEDVSRLLATVGLEQRSEDVARSLSYGEQRLLEVARALATRPRLILLDEPAAGLSEVDVEFLRGVIRRLRQMGITLLLVDHHVTFLMSVVDRVVVLNQGRVIFDGAATDARRDPGVIDAYLGAAAHAA
jgi:ABC-type branched-subunit amino acid transport system permease subunit/ABC-type branched-subunit amino acid transport system ATPase component